MLNKILLATDFSKTAELLMNCLSELKDLGIEEVLLVHVVNIQHAKLSAGQLKKKNEEKLQQVKNKIEEKGFKVDIRVPIGGPTEEINRIANQEDVGLILIASHGRGFINPCCGCTQI